MNELDFQQLNNKLDGLSSDVQVIKRHVVGDSEPERSLMFRVARHEQEIEEIRASKKAAISLGWTALGTALTAATMWAWTKLTGHQP